MDSNKKAVVTTLLYSSLFSFPLTEEELYRYLISPTKISKNEFSQTLKNLSPYLSIQSGYYALSTHKMFAQRRIAMQPEVATKQKLAEQYASLLSIIPTIYFIGLSGGLAAGSAEKGDDIDFFIITKKNSLFISRLLALFLLSILGKRRRAGERKVSDKICLNMWLDTSALRFSLSSHDLYTAREIAQLRPLVNKENTYESFLSENAWVASYLPHAFRTSYPSVYSKKSSSFFERLLSVMEIPARKLQLLLISRRQTSEVVSKHYVAFHPYDYKKEILTRFSQQLKKMQNYYK